MSEKNKFGLQNSPIGRNGNNEENVKTVIKTKGNGSSVNTGEMVTNNTTYNGEVHNSRVTPNNNSNN